MENTEMDDLGDNTVDPVDQTTDQTTDQETSFGGDDLLHAEGDIHDLSIAVPTGFAPSTDITQLGDDDRFADLEDQQTAKEILKGDILESVLGFRPKAVFGEWSRKLLLEGVELNRGTGRDKGVIGLKSGGKVVIKKRPAEDGGGFMWSESVDSVVVLKITKLKNTIVKAREEYEAGSFTADIGRRVDVDVDPGASTSGEGLATEAVAGEIVGSVEEEVVERIRTTRGDIERESGELRIPYSEFREVRGGLDLAILRQVGMKFSERMESLDKDIKHWEEKAEGEADPRKKKLYESVVRVERLTKDYIRIRNGLKPLSDEVLDIVKEVVGGSDELSLERFRRWAKKNMLGISAMAISIAGLITGIVMAARGALKVGAKVLGKIAGAVARVLKKLGPVFAALGSLVSTALSWGAKGILWMANNLWFLVIVISAALYSEYGRRRASE